MNMNDIESCKISINKLKNMIAFFEDWNREPKSKNKNYEVSSTLL